MTTYWTAAKGGNDSNGGTSYVDAKATVGAGVGLLSAGDTLIICGGSYTTSAVITINVSDVRLVGGFDSDGNQDGQTRPTISKTGAGPPWSSTTQIIDDNGSRNMFYLLTLDSGGLAGSCMDLGNYGLIISCDFANANGDHGVDTSSFGIIVDSIFRATTGAFRGLTANTSNSVINCLFKNNGDDGCSLGTASRAIGCIAHDNTGNGINAFGSGNAIIGCTAYNNTSNNFRMTGLGGIAIDCISESSGGYGYISSSSRAGAFNSTSLNDTSGVSSAMDTDLDDDFVTSGSIAFANAGSGLFSIGKGSAADGIGTPAAFTAFGTTTRDAGAIQRFNRGGAMRRARRG